MPSRRKQVTADVKAAAQYVFVGTVIGARASNLDGVPPEAGLAVVRVDNLLVAPPQVGLAAGQDVTVAAAEGTSFRDGDAFVFYAVSWHYGRTLGVQEIGREAIPLQAEAAASMSRSAQIDAVAARLQAIDFAIAERINLAELVVSGHVTAAEDIETVELNLEGSAWQSATIWVASTLKGVPPPELRVVVPVADKEYPDAPRTVLGQDGIWLLQRRDESPGGLWAPTRLDFHSLSALERIVALVSATS